MTIPADKALAVGKLLHPGREWRTECGGACYQVQWMSKQGPETDIAFYDPTTASECWAMVRYVVARIDHDSPEGASRYHKLMMTLVKDDPAALIDLVLAVGGEG